ncbi:acetyltransferase [Acinetobacter pittii]|uniref:acetyltransferase n=1 Tax=Acinetobacter pittii TaxID=48296 RepID=UPI000B361E9F|nr:acetyltransferase [Acinetobacter pittii]
MNKKVEKYGVVAVSRPKILATKQLDLSGDAGRQIIKSETKLALRTHSKTFKRLADM